MFFFTPRHSVSTGRHKNTSRFHVRRTAGEGSWETSGSMKSIWNGEAVIGSKTALVFKRKDKVTGAVTKTDWIMHEYLLISSSNQFQDLALCKIYYSGKEDTNVWEGTAKIMKRKLKNEPPRTCSDVTDPTIGQVFSPPEISSCMTQWEESNDQFLIPEQLVSREEKVKKQSAASTDEELLTEYASQQCSTVNVPSWDKAYCSPDITSALNEDNCFEGLDDILNLRDYDDL